MSSKTTNSTRRGGKRVPTVNSTSDGEISDSPTTPMVSTVVVEPEVKTVVEPKKKTITISLSEDEIQFITVMKDFIKSEERTASFWKNGVAEMIEAFVESGPKNMAGKIAAAAADAIEAKSRVSTKKTTERAPRKTSNHKKFGLKPAFAKVLENDEVQSITMKGGESLGSMLVADENGKVGMTKPQALQVVWAILGKYFKTATNKDGEPCYPVNPDTNKPAAYVADKAVLAKLPKDVVAFLKTIKNERVALTSGQKLISESCVDETNMMPTTSA